MYVDQDLNIVIEYNFSKDQRGNKYNIVPENLQLENKLFHSFDLIG